MKKAQQQEQQIKSVKVDKACIETLPPVHDVKIQYKDGTTESKSLSHKSIVRDFGDHLDSKTKHSSCFGKFFKEGSSKSEQSTIERYSDYNP